MKLLPVKLFYIFSEMMFVLQLRDICVVDKNVVLQFLAQGQNEDFGMCHKLSAMC